MVANISGHRDWAATECPGGTLYARLPAIRDAADTVAPVITGVTASPGRRGATVRWVTDEASTSLVKYRRRGVLAWTFTAGDTTLTTSHTTAIAGLARHTTYEYRVQSADVVGNTRTGKVAAFTTR
jgi:hypothetical protein